MLYVGQRPLDLIQKTRQSQRQRWILTPVRYSFILARRYVLNGMVNVARGE